MTKICGFIGTKVDKGIVKERLQLMTRAMKHDPDSHKEEEYATFANGGIALLKNPQDHENSLVYNEERSSCVGLGGHIVNFRGDKASPYEDKRGTPRKRDIDFLLHGFERGGEEGILEDLNGVFSLAYYSSVTRSLKVANDRYGFMPLYYYYDNNVFVFASEVKAILQVVGQQEFDWESCADFFYAGHMLGQKTLFRDIRALDTGQILTYREGDLRQRKYDDFTETAILDRREVSTEKLASLFTEAVRRRVREDRSNTLLLSGGLDSRLILFVLHNLGVAPRIVTLEHADEKGGADGRFASQVARHLGLEYELRPTKEGFYSSTDSLEVFFILDGMVPSWPLFIGQVYPELDPTMGTVWDGLGMGLLIGAEHIEGKIKHNLNYLLNNRTVHRPLLKKILTPEVFHALDENFQQRVQQEIDAVPASENQFLNFRIKHRTRRRMAVNPYQLYASKVEPSTPAIDKDFMDYVLSIPLDLKREHRIYLDMVRKHFPSMTTVPIISGGSILRPHGGQPLSFAKNKLVKGTSSALRHFAGRYRLKRRFKRLVRRPVSNKEHDTHKLIITILEKTYFERPFYNKELLRRLFREYRSGSSDYYGLFRVVFYIELWHLLFVERDCSILSQINVQPTGRATVE